MHRIEPSETASDNAAVSAYDPDARGQTSSESTGPTPTAETRGAAVRDNTPRYRANTRGAADIDDVQPPGRRRIGIQVSKQPDLRQPVRPRKPVKQPIHRRSIGFSRERRPSCARTRGLAGPSAARLAAATPATQTHPIPSRQGHPPGGVLAT